MRISGTAQVILEIRGLEAGYGKHLILHGVDLEVHRGSVVAVLGVNGAGKTTLLNAISGFVKPSKGEIFFAAKRITGAGPHQIFREGVVQISQSRDLFPEMSVEANLRLGAAVLGRAGNIEMLLRNVYASFPRLLERRMQQTQPSPAASSRCWPSVGPSWGVPSFCCLTSHQAGCRRNSWRRSARSPRR